MTFRFTITDNGDVPIVYINDTHLNVAHLTYAWSTKTEAAGSGANICIVDGYLDCEAVLRRFIFDILTGETKEVPLTAALDQNNGRVFEVCTTRGECYDSEIWEVRPFENLKPRDIIRIRDGGVYRKGLDGCGVWVIIDTVGMENGLLNVQPFILPKNDQIGHGGFLPGTVKPD